jgi:hypothetical protein
MDQQDFKQCINVNIQWTIRYLKKFINVNIHGTIRILNNLFM